MPHFTKVVDTTRGPAAMRSSRVSLAMPVPRKLPGRHCAKGRHAPGRCVNPGVALARFWAVAQHQALRGQSDRVRAGRQGAPPFAPTSREEVHGVACAADGRRPDDEWYPRSRLDVMHGPVQFVCVKDCGYLLTEPIGSTFLIFVS